MVGERIGIAGLRPGTADLLLDFSESGFDFPACAIALDDLRNGQGQVGGGHRRDPLGAPVDPDHAHLAAQGLEHDGLLGGHQVAHPTVEVERIGPRGGPQFGLHRLDAAQTLTVRAGSSGAFRHGRRPVVEDRVHAQAREQMGTGAERPAQQVEQAVVAELVVGDHRDRCPRNDPAKLWIRRTA
jgi:hypothetical protein